MYGVPADLDLTFLHGAELIQVRLGLYQVQFQFHPIGSISVEGERELRDAADVRIDGFHGGAERPPYQLHRLLGRRVSATEVSAPSWFSLRFESGDLLRVFDDNHEQESFQIEPGGIIA